MTLPDLQTKFVSSLWKLEGDDEELLQETTCFVAEAVVAVIVVALVEVAVKRLDCAERMMDGS